MSFRRKSLLQLTWPLFVVAVLNIGATVADTAILSAHSDELAAAVSMANLILDIPYEISAALGFGAMALVSRRLGRGDTEGAESLAWTALAANTLLNLLLAAALLVGEDSLIRLVNTPPEIVDGTRSYLRIVSMAMIFNGFLTASTAILRAYGHTVEILLLGILSNATYLTLNYLLVFGQGGFPEMGAEGSAWASFLVRGLGIVAIAAVLRWRLDWSIPARLLPHGRLRHLLEMTRLSFPALGESILFKLFTTVMVGRLALQGTTAVLTRSYTLTVGAFLSLVPYVFSQGNDVLVGYDAGRRDFETARARTVRNGLIAGLIVTSLAVVLHFFSDHVIGVFTEDPAILAGAGNLLLITVFFQPFQAMNTMCYNALRVAGDAYVPVLYSLATTWLLAFPIAWILIAHYGMGPAGLWWAVAAEEVVKCAILLTRWCRMRWTRHFISPSEKPPQAAG